MRKLLVRHFINNWVYTFCHSWLDRESRPIKNLRNAVLMRLLITFFGFGLLAGCAASTSGTRVQLDSATGKAGITEQAPFFTQEIKVGRVSYRDFGGILQAQIELINKSSETVLVEVKGKWYDTEGFEISSPAELWREVILSGKETKTVQMVAPRKEAIRMEALVRSGELSR